MASTSDDVSFAKEDVIIQGTIHLVRLENSWNVNVSGGMKYQFFGKFWVRTKFCSKSTKTATKKFNAILNKQFNPLSGNPTKWSNTIKKFARANELFECV